MIAIQKARRPTSNVLMLVVVMVTLGRLGSGAVVPTSNFKIGVNIVDLLWRRITTGGKNECAGAAIPCPTAIQASRLALREASENGFSVVRFGASGFWPVDQQLWFNNHTRPIFWAQFDKLLEDAAAVDVKVIPSLFWNIFAVVDLCRGHLSDIVVEHSCTHKAMELFTKEVVSRYSNHSAIYAWELTNELNLYADLNMTNGKAAIAPSLGTPSTRTSQDNISTADLISFQKGASGWIRRHDTVHPISTGHAVARPSAEHLRRSYHSPHRDWGADSRQDFQTNFRDICKYCELCSVHVYPGAQNQRWGLREVDLVNVAAQAVQNQSTQSVYLGEFGVSLPDRHDVSSLSYNFTASMLSHAKSAAKLATYWVWMFPGQNLTWSIYPGQDQRTINILQQGH